MKQILTGLILGAMVVTTANAEYWRDSYGNIARSGFGVCVTDSQGTYDEPDAALLECGDAEIVKENVARQVTIPVEGYSINFDFDKTDLDDDALAACTYLNNTVPLEGSVLQITGHTDAVGSEAYNLDLGFRRAQAVTDVLLHNYIMKDSKGETELVVLTHGKERANRRVEIEATWTEVVEKIVRHDRD